MKDEISNFQFTLDEQSSKDIQVTEEIKHRISDMKISVNSFVIVNLLSKENETPKVVFFQTTRSTSFKRTNYYYYEIKVRIPTENGKQIKMYRSPYIKLPQLLNAFKDICILRNFPDLSNLEDITEKVFNAPKNDVRYDLAKKAVTSYYTESNPDDTLFHRFVEALHLLYEEYNDADYGLCLADLYCELGQYEKARELYQSLTFKYSATYNLGTLIYQGKFGKPDYKLAYEYFKHTLLLLDDTIYRNSAKLQIAIMYRDGKYLKQNYDKYVKTVREIEKNVKDVDPCLPELYYELTKIELKCGNPKKALEYCSICRHYTYLFACIGGLKQIIEQCERVANLYFSLTEFDSDNAKLLDLLHVMNKPVKIVFVYDNTIYEIQTFYENNRIIVKFCDKYFNGAINFFCKALLNDKPILNFDKDILIILVEDL